MKEIQELFSRLGEGDQSVRSAVKEHIGLLVRNNCRSKKTEIGWMIINNAEYTPEMLYNAILGEFEMKLQKEIALSFESYRSLVLDTASRIISEGFNGFNRSLLQGNNKPWKRVEEDLFKYTYKWLACRNIRNPELVREIHIYAVETLFEKVKEKELVFEGSAALKSYYFSILEYKWKEYNKSLKKTQQFTDKVPDGLSEMPEDSSHDQVTEIRRYMKMLDVKEQYILKAYYFFEKKLNEIAADLGITADNCRVMKHRALQRLISMVGNENKG